MVFANSTCLSVRLRSELTQSWSDRISRLFSGVLQFVRHVGKELGLVFRRQRQLARLVFQGLARLLDFLVLALDFLILVREQAGLFLQLLVGLLQLFLAALQFMRQRLRLGQQILGPGVRLDRIDDDADAFGELLQKRLVRVAESFKRGEFEHALDLAFENDGQYENIARRRAAKPG